MMMEGEGKSESEWNIRLQKAGMKSKKRKVIIPFINQDITVAIRILYSG